MPSISHATIDGIKQTNQTDEINMDDEHDAKRQNYRLQRKVIDKTKYLSNLNQFKKTSKLF